MEDIKYGGALSTNFLMASLPCSHSSHPTTELNIHEDETDGARERRGKVWSWDGETEGRKLEWREGRRRLVVCPKSTEPVGCFGAILSAAAAHQQFGFQRRGVDVP